MTALAELELRIRGLLYRSPLPLYAAIAALVAVLAFVVPFGAMKAAESGMSDSVEFPGTGAMICAVMVAVISWYEERKKREASPEIADRLAIDRAMIAPTSVPRGEQLPRSSRKKLRAVSDSKAMNFVPFIIMAPMALIMIVIPMSNGEAVWSSVAFIAALFSICVLIATVGVHRARNAELVLGRAG